MFSYSINSVSKRGKLVAILGFAIWITASVFGVWNINGELIGAAGAVGICFLVPFVFIEQANINERMNAMQHFYRDVKIHSETMTHVEYEGLDEEEKEQFGEAESGYLVAQLNFEADITRVKFLEISAGILFTLQWAFSNLMMQFFVRSQACCS